MLSFFCQKLSRTALKTSSAASDSVFIRVCPRAIPNIAITATIIMMAVLVRLLYIATPPFLSSFFNRGCRLPLFHSILCGTFGTPQLSGHECPRTRYHMRQSRMWFLYTHDRFPGVPGLGNTGYKTHIPRHCCIFPRGQHR